MIKDIELLQGAAILRILQFAPGVRVKQMVDLHNSLYELATDTHTSAVLLKLSTKKKPPWQYSFSDYEQKAIEKLRQAKPQTRIFWGFICHIDGICCVPAQVLSEIMGDKALAGKSISIRRSERSSYRISGPQRKKFRRTFPANAWPRSIIQESLT